MTMATKIVLLNEGKIQQVGVYSSMKAGEPFRRGIIGSPTMNIFTARSGTAISIRWRRFCHRAE